MRVRQTIGDQSFADLLGVSNLRLFSLVAAGRGADAEAQLTTEDSSLPVRPFSSATRIGYYAILHILTKYLKCLRPA